MTAFSALRRFNRFEMISRLIKGASGGQSCRAFHAGEFPMRPSVFQWRKFKDFVHFYTMLGIIPLTLITTYVNITVGPAELAEIPEGYEPKHWEYYRNPITRFFAKHLIRDKRIDYEGMVCYMNEESEKIIMRRIEKMVHDFMKYRSDYQSWYYRPIDAYHSRYEREEWKHLRDYVEGQRNEVVEEGFFSGGARLK